MAPLQGVRELYINCSANLEQGFTTLPSEGPSARLKEPARTTKFSGPNLTATGMKGLASLKGLQKLHLGFTRVTEAGLKELAPLQELQELSLYGSVTDADLKEVASLKGLQKLHIDGLCVTNAGLKELTPLRELQELSIEDSRNVTDAGLKELARLKALRSLSVCGERVRVTDAGLKELASLKGLRFLGLSGTSVTDAGLKALRTQHPNCRAFTSDGYLFLCYGHYWGPREERHDSP